MWTGSHWCGQDPAGMDRIPLLWTGSHCCGQDPLRSFLKPLSSFSHSPPLFLSDIHQPAEGLSTRQMESKNTSKMMIYHDQVGFIPEMCWVTFIGLQILNHSSICFKKENRKTYRLPSLSPTETPTLLGCWVEAEPRASLLGTQDALVTTFV